jgi:hypothetical protein
MAEIQSGTKFAAIAPSTDVDRRSSLVNTKSLEYTIEDIAAAVGGDVDLSAYLTIADAATTYQPLSTMTDDVNDIIYDNTRYQGFQVITSTVSTGANLSLNGIANNSRQGRYRLVLLPSADIQVGGFLTLYIESTAITENSVILASVNSSGFNERLLVFPNQCGIGFAYLVITPHSSTIVGNSQFIDISYAFV